MLTGAGPNDCKVAPGGLGTQIATQVSPMVDAIFSGHSHQGYNCVVTDPAGNPRPVTQGSSFGRLMTVVDLKIDTKTRDVVRSATTANNEIVTRTVTPDPGAQAIVDGRQGQGRARRQPAGRHHLRRHRQERSSFRGVPAGQPHRGRPAGCQRRCPWWP